MNVTVHFMRLSNQAQYRIICRLRTFPVEAGHAALLLLLAAMSRRISGRVFMSTDVRGWIQVGRVGDNGLTRQDAVPPEKAGNAVWK